MPGGQPEGGGGMGILGFDSYITVQLSRVINSWPSSYHKLKALYIYATFQTDLKFTILKCFLPNKVKKTV